jgi:hypothetical protein
MSFPNIALRSASMLKTTECDPTVITGTTGTTEL